MHQEQRQRTHDLLQERGVKRALFAKPESVKWLTGFVAPVQTGPNPFAGGPPLVWYEEGHFVLVVVDEFSKRAAAFAAEPNCTLETYVGYTLDAPLSGGAHLLAKLRDLAGQSATPTGIEAEAVTRLITDAFPSNTVFTSIDGWLEPLRMIKTPEELEKLKANFALTDVGHAAARQAVQAGKREIDVWNALNSAIQAAAGQRVQVGNDCVVGHREANGGGWPLDYEILPQDSFIVDISTVLYGYWSDSCATYYAGERTVKQAKMHKTVQDVLAYGISLVRPGLVAKDLDQKMRQFIADAGYPVYSHHTGHGVGVFSHEAPRIVPYNEEVLQEGMVIMLEPGIYFPGETSIRLEDALFVTKDGAEVLTHHNKD